MDPTYTNSATGLPVLTTWRRQCHACGSLKVKCNGTSEFGDGGRRVYLLCRECGSTTLADEEPPLKNKKKPSDMRKVESMAPVKSKQHVTEIQTC